MEVPTLRGSHVSRRRGRAAGWEDRLRAHLVAFHESLRDVTSSRRSHMVSSVSFPRRSMKHWPTKAVVESGGVQVGQSRLRACVSRQENRSHLILGTQADRETDTP